MSEPASSSPTVASDTGSTFELVTPAMRRLLPTIVPAIVVGIASALLYVGISRLADWIEDQLWTTIPGQLGISGQSSLWIFVMLTLTGIVIGVLVTILPGHAGPDPATVGLAEPPMAVSILPGLAIVLVISLAGGVSLGPENPIMAIAIGLAVAAGSRVAPGVPAAGWSGLAFSGMLGSMFGTPVAAALVIGEVSSAPGPLWDRLFAPIIAAAAGAITVLLVAGDSFVLQLAPYPQAQPVDLITGAVIAVVAAVLGMAAVYAFPRFHALFQRLGPPLATIIVGGVLMGLLGAIGGPLTLFKGLSQMKELADTATSYSAGALFAFAAIKLVAMLVAGTSGFRGGRIFPAIFVAVAFGLAVNAAIPDVPQAIAVGASLVGLLAAVTRSGWLALFMAALMVGDPAIFPVLTIILLPAWLIVTGRPEMIVKRPEPAAADPGAHGANA
jgi:H+/Cl- antiporter ClcA